MRRIYQSLIQSHFDLLNQMAFLSGPRQVGKTTLVKNIDGANFYYFNWDIDKDRQLILSGNTQIGVHCHLNQILKQKPYIAFDEIHKYPNWKNFLKGFYDAYKDQTKISVTGSAKLNVYRRNADSLLGRYFLYRVHPFSVAELLGQNIPETEIKMPSSLAADDYNHLIKFGGFPDPFLKQSEAFSRRWNKMRSQLLFREDIRSLTQIQEITQLEILLDLLKQQTGSLINLTNFANKINVSINTIKRWLSTLEHFYLCFQLKPWTKNITRSLLKEPKIYLWNWADIADQGKKAENFIASHLLKSVHLWTDMGLGEYGLYFLRDKEKREIDFCVTKNSMPWFLVEVKYTDNQPISKSLYYYKEHTKAQHAFQVIIDAPYVEKNCFDYVEPIKVPALTLLSQLV